MAAQGAAFMEGFQQDCFSLPAEERTKHIWVDPERKGHLKPTDMYTLQSRIMQVIDLPTALCEITIQGHNNVMTVDLGCKASSH